MRSASASPTASQAPGREAIVAAAIREFGRAGIAATSLRAVAAAAEVSPALVVHHFGGKQGLVAAVDAAVVAEFGDAYVSAAGEGEGDDLLARRAEQTARVMRERPDVCAYLGRALVEGTAGSGALFRALIGAGRDEIEALAEGGSLRPDADRLWATLQHFFLIWAPLSFMPLLKETLGGELLDPDQLERWVAANLALLREGLYE